MTNCTTGNCPSEEAHYEHKLPEEDDSEWRPVCEDCAMGLHAFGHDVRRKEEAEP